MSVGDAHWDSASQEAVFELGNAWIAFGDLLHEQLAVMGAAQTGLNNGWWGDAATAAAEAWGGYYDKSGAARDGLASMAMGVVEECWHLGESINYYAMLRTQQEDTVARQKLMQMIAAIFGNFLALVAGFLDGAALGMLGRLLGALGRGLGAEGAVVAALGRLETSLGKLGPWALKTRENASWTSLESWKLAAVDTAKFGFHLTWIMAAAEAVGQAGAGLPVDLTGFSPIPLNEQALEGFLEGLMWAPMGVPLYFAGAKFGGKVFKTPPATVPHVDTVNTGNVGPDAGSGREASGSPRPGGGGGQGGIAPEGLIAGPGPGAKGLAKAAPPAVPGFVVNRSDVGGPGSPGPARGVSALEPPVGGTGLAHQGTDAGGGGSASGGRGPTGTQGPAVGGQRPARLEADPGVTGSTGSAHPLDVGAHGNVVAGQTRPAQGLGIEGDRSPVGVRAEVREPTAGLEGKSAAGPGSDGSGQSGALSQVRAEGGGAGEAVPVVAGQVGVSRWDVPSGEAAVEGVFVYRKDSPELQDGWAARSRELSAGLARELEDAEGLGRLVAGGGDRVWGAFVEFRRTHAADMPMFESWVDVEARVREAGVHGSVADRVVEAVHRVMADHRTARGADGSSSSFRSAAELEEWRLPGDAALPAALERELGPLLADGRHGVSVSGLAGRMLGSRFDVEGWARDLGVPGDRVQAVSEAFWVAREEHRSASFPGGRVPFVDRLAGEIRAEVGFHGRPWPVGG